MMVRWLMLIAALVWMVVGTWAGWSTTHPGRLNAQRSGTVSGVVRDADGPVDDATVRVQATRTETATDAQGQFTLAGLIEGVPVSISAWKHGYYSAKSEGVVPPAAGVTLTLIPYQTNDNPDYEWMPPMGEESCASCKPGVTQIWFENSAHAQASVNPRFLTMYNGTDVDGNRSSPTRYGQSRDYGRFPLPPDISTPYYGPGYKLDFPNTLGNCAACHTPGAAIDAPYGTDPNTVTAADTFGIHCDFCHKVADVMLDQATGLPYPNRSGVLSMDVRRPFPDDPDRYQLFFGTFDDDNVPEEDTYLPLIEESQFCAPCHFGMFWDTVVYNSFGEWLESSYSDPETGQTCQGCHMPAPSVLDGEVITNVAPDEGGVERDPLAIHAHTQPGAADETLLQDTAELSLSALREGQWITVTIDVSNAGAGHHIPTDSPLRQIFLIVTATDEKGHALLLENGPVLPDWAGDLKGLPGVYYAKILEEIWTKIRPTGAYWNPTRIIEDTRLPALETDTSTYVFASPKGFHEGAITVEVRLVFRRAFYDLMQQKGWNAPDITMERLIVQVP